MTREERLERANVVRSRRAEIKRALGNRSASAAAIIVGPPEEALGMRVIDVLKAQRYWGPTRAAKLMRYAGVPELAPLRDLKPSQRDLLVRALRGRA